MKARTLLRDFLISLTATLLVGMICSTIYLCHEKCPCDRGGDGVSGCPCSKLCECKRR